MRKTLLFSGLAVLLCTPAWASEMVVQLKSGNRLVIQYSGAIEGVTLEGSDAIVGMSMPQAQTAPTTAQAPPPAAASVASQPSPAAPATDKAAAGPKGEERSFKMRWASPKMED